MKKLVIFLFFILVALVHVRAQSAVSQPPAYLLGRFEDDYQVKYTINDTLWLQLPNTRFHIIKWNTEKKYIIARNDAHNPGEGGLYTRIDFMTFDNMAPWKWGYCLTAYSAPTDAAAEATAAADRDDPMKGCGGYPFSRMKARLKGKGER